jgi:hypothetical protein
LSTSTVRILQGFFRRLTVLSTSLATITKLPNKLLRVTVTSTLSIRRAISKIMATITENVIVILTKIGLNLISFSLVIANTATINKAITKTLSVLSTSIATITKQAVKVLTYLSTTSSSIILNIGKTLSYVVTETASLFVQKVIYRILSVVVTSTVTIKSFLAKIILIVSNVISRVNKRTYRVLTVISNTIAIILISFFPRLGTTVRFTFIINTRDRLLNLFKIRTELANKRQSKVAK